MRSLLISAVLGLSALGVLGGTPREANAQWRWRQNYVPYAPYRYYVPGYYYAPPAYFNPYSTMRYSTPYAMPYYPPTTYMPSYSMYPPSQTYSATPYAAQTYVAVRDNYFEQPTLTVARGTVVRWTNYGRHTHTVTAENGMFASQDLNPGAAYDFAFNQAGSFVYYCAHHPEMRGEIVVR